MYPLLQNLSLRLNTVKKGVTRNKKVCSIITPSDSSDSDSDIAPQKKDHKIPKSYMHKIRNFIK